MKFKKRDFLSAVSAVAALVSFGALSDGAPVDALVIDPSASAGWSGEYYVESGSESKDSFKSFAEKKAHYLKSKEVEQETEEFEEDPAGKWKPLNKVIPHGDSFEEESVTHSMQQANSTSSSSGKTIPNPVPSPSGLPFPYRMFPFVDVPNSTPEIPSVATPPESEAKGVEHTDTRPQAFYYYNSGYLQNATQLGREGRGYVKVFQERGGSEGRGWGTRSMVKAIQTVAEEFAEKFPGRERIQIADMAAKNGGNIGHGSHKNGLDADVIFLRKLNRIEQPITGGYGKNGFKEQFVANGPVTYRTHRDSRGRKRVSKSYSRKTTSNFDVEANFEMLMLFEKHADVRMYFIDQVLIRDLFRYAEAKELTDDPATQAMLDKLDHEPSHADHVHIRLNCQDTDGRCVSANGRMPSKKKFYKGKGKKTAKSKKLPAKKDSVKL